jgi:signal transduction histidine kinase
MPDHRAGSAPGPVSLPVLGRLLAIFLTAALLTGGAVLALYLQDRAAEESLFEQAGHHLTDLHADLIARELEAVESELLYLSGQAALRRYLGGDRGAREDLEAEYLLFCRQRHVYDQIRYLDADGRERVRVNFNDGRPAAVPESELQPKADRYYFTEAMRLGRGEVFVSAFDLNVEHGEIERPLKPTLRFATPVFDVAGAKRGVLVLNYLGAALLRELAEVSATFPGKALLLNREGDYLRGPVQEDEWGFMLGHGRTFAVHHPDAWAQVTRSRGQFRISDGLFTYRLLLARQPGGEPESRAVGLIVMAHTPPAVLEGRSAQLLRRLLLLYAAALLVLLPLAWYLAYVGSLRRARERQLAASESRLRALSAQLITAQEEERRGLSRDLHDELGQIVTSVTLDLQRAGLAVEPARKDDLIGRALRGTGCLLDRIQEISARVRPPMLDDLGLKDAVQSLLSDYERRTGIATKTDLVFAHKDVPHAVSENVYRILQEALTNVSRHARTSEVSVGLHVTLDRAVLTVRDAGIGFDPAARDGKSLGLLGMRERAELLGGTCTVAARPGQGTVVEVTIPLGECHDPTE